MGAVSPQARVRDYPLFRKDFSSGEYCLLAGIGTAWRDFY
jgi:hypothetical protein